MTHTGVQSIATITNLQSELDSRLGIGDNAVSASRLETGRLINGVLFDGTENINIMAHPYLHTHAISEVVGLQAALDNKMNVGDLHLIKKDLASLFAESTMVSNYYEPPYFGGDYLVGLPNGVWTNVIGRGTYFTFFECHLNNPISLSNSVRTDWNIDLNTRDCNDDTGILRILLNGNTVFTRSQIPGRLYNFPLSGQITIPPGENIVQFQFTVTSGSGIDQIIWNTHNFYVIHE